QKILGRGGGDGALQGSRERVQAQPTLQELRTLVALLVGEPVKEQRDAGIVHHFRPGDIDVPRNRVAEIKGEKAQVVVNAERVAVVFDVAADLQVASGIEHRPRGRG